MIFAAARFSVLATSGDTAFSAEPDCALSAPRNVFSVFLLELLIVLLDMLIDYLSHRSSTLLYIYVHLDFLVSQTILYCQHIDVKSVLLILLSFSMVRIQRFRENHNILVQPDLIDFNQLEKQQDEHL